jgi:DNA-binding PadR family transcriptional regulator
MNLSFVGALVLNAVASGSRYGFDIMDSSGLPGGTVYPALRRLERAGFVTSSWEADEIAREAKRPRRRYYEITKTGEEVLQGALERFPLLRQPVMGRGDPVGEGKA